MRHPLLRLARHVVTDHASARRRFPPAELRAVEQAIAEGEKRHRGQVCVAIEASLPLARVLAKLAPRERALEVFGLARVWDTAENCGVLIYVLLADRDVEIIADRGIHERVGEKAWSGVCRTMERAFAQGRFGEGLTAGVAEVNALLERHFPDDGTPRANELANRPLVL